MNYKKHYVNLIKSRYKRKLSKEIYYEKHHIIPKSWGGSDKKDNIINLTAREHYIAHWLLFRMRPHSCSASFSFWKMSVKSPKNVKRNYKVSSRAYAEAKEFSSKHFSEIYKGRKLPKNELWVKNNSESIKKPIYQYTLNGVLVKKWSGTVDVVKSLGYSKKNISRNLTGKGKSAYGFIWVYENSTMDIQKNIKKRGYKKQIIDSETDIIYESISEVSKVFNLNKKTLANKIRYGKSNFKYYEK